MSRRIGGRTLAWLVLALVVAIALVMAVKRGGESATSEDRVASIARTIRCPQCRSQSAAESAAPAAVAIRAEIARRVAAGESTAAIQQYFVSRYGNDVLLSPEGSGFTALVWILPVVGLVAGAAVVVASLSRWRAPSSVPSPADTALVERALADTALVERALADNAAGDSTEEGDGD